MIVSAGGAIVFVVSLAGLAIWILVYFTFVAHYVITTLTVTSTGANEVEFPIESFVGWLWKPILCVWVLSAWCVPAAIMILPLTSFGPWPCLVAFGLLLGAIYPLSLASVLYQQNWLMLFDPMVVWRMLRHFRAFLYVLAVTSTLVAACVALLFLAVSDGPMWLFVFVLILPMTFLMWARHWGRLSWLTLNYVPSRRKRKKRKTDGDQAASEIVEDETPEIDVEEVEESVCENPPAMVDEDEWSKDKAPYAMADVEPEASADEREAVLVSAAAYYVERASREAEEDAERATAVRATAPARRKPTTFREAMFVGMWSFLLQRGTLRAWMTLALMTLAGIFLLILLGVFRPLV